MTLKGLLTLLTQRPEFRRLVQQLQEAEALPALTGITEAARPYIIAALASTLQQPLLVVLASETQANLVADTLKILVQQPEDVLYFPDRDALPFERLISDASDNTTTHEYLDLFNRAKSQSDSCLLSSCAYTTRYSTSRALGLIV